MQPYLFAYKGYFDLIKAVDIFVIYDDCQWKSNSFINRNYFPNRYTFPVEKDSHTKNINERYYKDLKTACEKFPIQTDLTKRIFSGMKPEYNVAFNNTIAISWLMNYLSINTVIMRSSDIRHGTGVQGLIDIVKALGGDTYINLPGGKKLYNQREFGDIKLEFIKTKPGNSILCEI